MFMTAASESILKNKAFGTAFHEMGNKMVSYMNEKKRSLSPYEEYLEIIKPLDDSERSVALKQALWKRMVYKMSKEKGRGKRPK